MNNFSDNSPVSAHFAEVSLRYSPQADQSLLPKLNTPEEVYKFLLAIWDKDTLEISESFYVLLFNNKNKLLGWSRISLGSKSATVVDVTQVVTLALLGNASKVVIAHNHPSGETRASHADIKITGRILQALELHDIKLNDHLIVTREEYYSFCENGLMHSSENQR